MNLELIELPPTIYVQYKGDPSKVLSVYATRDGFNIHLSSGAVDRWRRKDLKWVKLPSPSK